jgi:hypothetical protein
LRNAMGGTNPTDCQIFLNVHRHVYDNGGHFVDSPQDIILSTYGYDVMKGRRDP